jgi:two-component system, cell cycle sensor histidine kinase and response regulator CckA
MNKQLRVLIVEDSVDDTELLLQELRCGGYDPIYERVETASAMKILLERQTWDIILADYTLPLFGGMGALTELQLSGLDLPFIIISDVTGEDKAVVSTMAGAHDHIMKKDIKRLVPAIERELKKAENRQKQSRIEEEVLSTSEERLQAILDNTPAIVCLKDLQGRYIFVNKQFEKLLHMKNNEIQGKTDHDLFPKEIADAFQVNDRKVIESKTSLEFDEVLLPQNNKLHSYLSIKFPLFDSTGTLHAICDTSMDITERKRTEAEKTKLREQLYQIQKLESIGKLAEGIAHDFNNILSAIIGYAELLKKRMRKDSSLMDYIQKILESAERATKITQNLLTFSRKQISNPRLINLNTIILWTENLISRLIPENIKLETALTDEGCIVMADSSQIEHVLLNLTLNARDAMPDGGILTIRTDSVEVGNEFIRTYGYGRTGRYALISVSDTGIGIDNEIKKRIFEPFFTTKKNKKGTGLGLAVVYGIVKQHQGYIHVDSELGKGTTFTIYLPFIASHIEKRTIEEKRRIGFITDRKQSHAT